MVGVKQRALPAGSVVYNRYRIEQTLGEGGFGVTYLVTDLRDNTIAAMKEYMPVDIAVRSPDSDLVYPKPTNEEPYAHFREKFLKEARTIYQFRGHPNIVDVQHLFEENNTAYYVMEYIAGQDLKRLLEKNQQRLPWEFLKPVMAQTVSALKELHKENFTHCDISPDNILVLNSGQVKLIDFGAVKNGMNTKSSIILLKRGFAPPEQLSAKGRIGPWTDVYALAVTIYRAYTGRMPPPSEERLIQDQTVWPTEMGITPPSPRWEMALKRAMALRISDRYHDVEEFWREMTAEPVPVRRSWILVGARGYYEATQVPIKGEFYFGRDPGSCNFLYPVDAPGVSFRHCCVWEDGGTVYVMDMRSSCGTWLGSTKLIPGRAYPMSPGDMIFLGSMAESFYLAQQG